MSDFWQGAIFGGSVMGLLVGLLTAYAVPAVKAFWQNKVEVQNRQFEIAKDEQRLKEKALAEGYTITETPSGANVMVHHGNMPGDA